MMMMMMMMMMMIKIQCHQNREENKIKLNLYCLITIEIISKWKIRQSLHQNLRPYGKLKDIHATWYPLLAQFLFYLFFPTSVSILLRIVVCIYMYIHISDCVETVYELPLLPNNTASETFFQKSEAVQSVDWIFMNRMPACRWLGEYVTLDRKF